MPPHRLQAWQACVSGVSATPLEPGVFATRARTLNYAVGTASPEAYRLRACASFLDALSFVKPGIYLRNPWLTEMFETLGDVGYLCDTPEAMRGVMASVAERFPADRYAAQCRRIVEGRRRFEPAAAGRRLREILQ